MGHLWEFLTCNPVLPLTWQFCSTLSLRVSVRVVVLSVSTEQRITLPPVKLSWLSA